MNEGSQRSREGGSVAGHGTNYGDYVQLRYSDRLYPAPGQRIALAKAFGCARVVFNDALAARQAAHASGEPYITDAQMFARLTESKATPTVRAHLSSMQRVRGEGRPQAAERPRVDVR
jgi:hypothetical protein